MTSSILGALRYLPALLPGIQVIKELINTFKPSTQSQTDVDKSIVNFVKEFSRTIGLDPNRIIIVEDKERQYIAGTGTSFGKTVLFVDSKLWREDQPAARYFIKYSLEHISRNNYFKLPLINTIVSLATAILIPRNFSILASTGIVLLATYVTYSVSSWWIKYSTQKSCFSRLQPEEAGCGHNYLNQIKTKTSLDVNEQLASLTTLLKNNGWGFRNIPMTFNKSKIEDLKILANVHLPFPKI
jgi:hypothetical protein